MRDDRGLAGLAEFVMRSFHRDQDETVVFQSSDDTATIRFNSVHVYLYTHGRNIRKDQRQTRMRLIYMLPQSS